LQYFYDLQGVYFLSKKPRDKSGLFNFYFYQPNIKIRKILSECYTENFLFSETCAGERAWFLSRNEGERAEEQASPPRWGGRSGLREKKIFW
jgi:hypothetical protein